MFLSTSSSVLYTPIKYRVQLYYSHIITEYFQKVLLMSKLYSLYFKTKLSFSRCKFFMLSQLNVEKTQCNIMQEDYKFFFFLKIDTHTQKKEKLLSRRFFSVVRLLYYKQPY